jgi:hypothetical protein
MGWITERDDEKLWDFDEFHDIGDRQVRVDGDAGGVPSRHIERPHSEPVVVEFRLPEWAGRGEAADEEAACLRISHV